MTWDALSGTATFYPCRSENCGVYKQQITAPPCPVGPGHAQRIVCDVQRFRNRTHDPGHNLAPNPLEVMPRLLGSKTIVTPQNLPLNRAPRCHVPSVMSEGSPSGLGDVRDTNTNGRQHKPGTVDCGTTTWPQEWRGRWDGAEHVGPVLPLCRTRTRLHTRADTRSHTRTCLHTCVHTCADPRGSFPQQREPPASQETPLCCHLCLLPARTQQ